MNKTLIALLLGIGIATNAGAQSFTQKLQTEKKGSATVTITHDKAIDDLVNKNSAATTTPAEKTSSTETTAQSQDEQTTTTGVKQRINGYRIQVYAGGNSRADRQRAQQIGNNIRAMMPREQVFVHFYPPRWICRVGSYRTYEDADKVMQQLKAMGYNSCTIVRANVTVNY